MDVSLLETGRRWYSGGMDWCEDRLGSAERGENPTVLRQLSTGFAVIGDTQHLPGYCLLLHRGPADHLSDLPHRERRGFLGDLALLGEAVENACRSLDSAFRRVNYEILGNAWQHLHGHVHARYEWEPDEHKSLPMWRYDERQEPRFALGPQHEPLREALIRELHQVVDEGVSRGSRRSTPEEAHGVARARRVRVPVLRAVRSSATSSRCSNGRRIPGRRHASDASARCERHARVLHQRCSWRRAPDPRPGEIPRSSGKPAADAGPRARPAARSPGQCA